MNSTNRSRDRFPQLLAGLTLVSISMIISSSLWAAAIRNIKQSGDAVVVIGAAQRQIKSDYIVWRISISSQQPTTPAAYKELKAGMERVRAYLKKANVPDTAITLSALDTTPITETINGRETGKVIASKLTQKLEIRSGEVDRISKLSEQITELINEGVPLVSEAPEYLYNNLSKLRIEMVAEATKDAKKRAEAIASSTGNHVTGVRSADAGVFQVTRRFSTEVSNGGSYDTTSIDKDITSVVTVKFGIE
jgi:uncharacterized protein